MKNLPIKDFVKDFAMALLKKIYCAFCVLRKKIKHTLHTLRISQIFAHKAFKNVAFRDVIKQFFALIKARESQKSQQIKERIADKIPNIDSIVDSKALHYQKRKILFFNRFAFRQLLRLLSTHKVLFLIYAVLPLLVGWFIYAVFMASLPRNLPIGVVDFDRSVLSNEALFMIDSSVAVKIAKSYSNISQAKEDLAISKIYALVVIPHHYEKDIKQGNGTQITLYFNAQFVLIGKAISSALEGVVGTLNAKQWSGKNLVKSKNLNLAIASSIPIFSQIIPLYNSSNNYSQFMLTLLLPCMLQILSALGMLHLLRHTPKSLKSLLTRYCFNSLVFVFWALCEIVLLKWLGFENRGDLGLLVCGSALLVFGVNGVVVFIQSVLGDFKKAVGFVAIYTAPSLAFAGVTYPQSAMNVLALFWSKFLPISHFMELFIQQANYGGEADLGFEILGGMLWFLLFLALGVGIYALKQDWRVLPKIHIKSTPNNIEP